MSVVTRLNDDVLQNYVQKAPENAEQAVTLFQQEGGFITLEALRSNIPIKTGRMRESSFLRNTPRGFSVGVDHPDAVFVDQGTGPHTIFPRTAKVLHWYGPLGDEHFAIHVHHPGFIGRHFVQKTRDFITVELKRLWTEILQRVFG